MSSEKKDGGAHTSTPWDFCDEATENDNFARTIYGPRGDYDALAIARVDQNGAHNDAEFIVRACNAHDDLVAALRDLVIESGGSAIPNSSLTAARDRAIVALAALSSYRKQGE
ncbi:hypothetical protein V5G24_20100 [Xanthobacter sp. VTT E-85241]|uniref:hypothetical protein n=1 Tax=Roseixanthobacter finlandensis TaxID=3119922 RepID=UPI0037298609